MLAFLGPHGSLLPGVPAVSGGFRSVTGLPVSARIRFIATGDDRRSARSDRKTARFCPLQTADAPAGPPGGCPYRLPELPAAHRDHPVRSGHTQRWCRRPRRIVWTA
ncbi:hypothetical protein JCM4914_63670 [Streptomyces platensis subsp. malvinus]